MASASQSSIRFEDFAIDRRRGELRKGGEIIAIEPQVLDLLAFLASEPGRVFSRDEIIESVWNGRIVSDSAISTRINAARQAVGDDGKSQRIIRTIPRRGFLFVPETQADKVPSDGAGPDASDQRNDEGTVPPLPDKPSIAVLPFENLSGDPEQAYFSDGITDDLTTELARFNDLFVIARQSAFAYRQTSKGLEEISRELGVRYLVQGSARRTDSRVRIKVELADAQTGRAVWAERFDRDLNDIFAVQDEITAIILNALVGRITDEHFRRASLSRPNSLRAYDHALRALVLFQRYTREDNLHARAEAQMAVDQDETFARAHALIAWTYNNDAAFRWDPDAPTAYEIAANHAARSVGLNDDEAWGHAALGFSEIWGSRNHGPGLAALKKSVALHPSMAVFRGWYSQALCFTGRPDEGLQQIEKAIRLNPHHPPIYLHWLARVFFTLERHDEALAAVEQVIYAMPENTNAMALAAACYASVGKMENAHNAIDRALSIAPTLNAENVWHATPYQRPQDMDRYLKLLADAGLPN